VGAIRPRDLESLPGGWRPANILLPLSLLAVPRSGMNTGIGDPTMRWSGGTNTPPPQWRFAEAEKPSSHCGGAAPVVEGAYLRKGVRTWVGQFVLVGDAHTVMHRTRRVLRMLRYASYAVSRRMWVRCMRSVSCSGGQRCHGCGGTDWACKVKDTSPMRMLRFSAHPGVRDVLSFAPSSGGCTVCRSTR